MIGKAITEKFYGMPPKYSYFFGSSSGGGQGLRSAQRFPSDFDGIIVGESGGLTPGADPSRPQNARGGGRLLYANNVRTVTPDEIRMLHKEVMGRCDNLDGLQDGIITDPRACPFKPADLLCKSAKTASCLTQDQVATLDKVYATGPMLGSEIAWIGAFVAEDGSAGRYTLVRSTNPNTYRYQWVFNDATNVDLRPFKAAGGKLIMRTGWADEIVNPHGMINYYESVEALLRSREATQDFFRFFVVPGQSHIPGNVGAESVDYIKVMEDWVERGQAPDVIVGHKLKRITHMMGPTYLEKDLVPENRLYSRPHYPWPIQARYKGKGDPDDAASFGPWDPVSKEWIRQL